MLQLGMRRGCSIINVGFCHYCFSPQMKAWSRWVRGNILTASTEQIGLMFVELVVTQETLGMEIEGILTSNCNHFAAQTCKIFGIYRKCQTFISVFLTLASSTITLITFDSRKTLPTWNIQHRRQSKAWKVFTGSQLWAGVIKSSDVIRYQTKPTQIITSSCVITERGCLDSSANLIWGLTTRMAYTDAAIYESFADWKSIFDGENLSTWADGSHADLMTFHSRSRGWLSLRMRKNVLIT